MDIELLRHRGHPLHDMRHGGCRSASSRWASLIPAPPQPAPPWTRCWWLLGIRVRTGEWLALESGVRARKTAWRVTTVTRNGGTLSLGSFLAALEARLTELTPEQVKDTLLAHAEHLVPRERAAFLAIFSERLRDGDDLANQRPTRCFDPGDRRIYRTAAFGCVRQWLGWDDEIHDERAFGDESWVDEMDGLFAAASDAFLEGDLHLAREALASLLKAFELEGETQAFCGSDSPDLMVSTDIGEAKARYLRAVYETTRASERPCGAARRDTDPALSRRRGKLGGHRRNEACPAPRA